MQTTAALLLKSLHHCCRIYCSVASENTALEVAEITALQTSVNKQSPRCRAKWGPARLNEHAKKTALRAGNKLLAGVTGKRCKKRIWQMFLSQTPVLRCTC